MAILNLLDLKPTTISRDLTDKYILLYGGPKVGKTSFAAKCPNNLMFCFERGVNFQEGIYAVDIPQWTDFKALLRQLEKPEIKEKFHTVTIDTVSIAWDLCEQFICNNNNVKTIGDIPWGRGYSLLREEFSNSLRKISMLGYGIILITHSTVKTKKVEGDSEETVEFIAPNIPEKAQGIVNALVDIIGYIDCEWVTDSNGNPRSKRTLITRATPNIKAGSRLPYLPATIPFDEDGYQSLIDAINYAIDKQAEKGAVVTEATARQAVIEHRPFAETIEDAKNQWERIVGIGESAKPEKAQLIMDKVEKIFGEPMKLSEIPESKQDLFEILIDELRSL